MTYKILGPHYLSSLNSSYSSPDSWCPITLSSMLFLKHTLHLTLGSLIFSFPWLEHSFYHVCLDHSITFFQVFALTFSTRPTRPPYLILSPTPIAPLPIPLLSLHSFIASEYCITYFHVILCMYLSLVKCTSKLHMDRNLCLFHSWISLKCLWQCLEHRCSIHFFFFAWVNFHLTT